MSQYHTNNSVLTTLLAFRRAWKFDPQLFDKRSNGNTFSIEDQLPWMQSPTMYLRSEHGMIDDQMAAESNTLFGPQRRMIELPDASHHPMLDQPLALITAIRMSLTASGLE